MRPATATASPRDPEAFGFGLYTAFLSREDENLIESKLTHPMVSLVSEILGPVTPAMSDKARIRGTPARVAEQVQAYVDAGANWISCIDMMPAILDPADAATAITRSFDIAGRLRAANKTLAAT
jgi:alkanesulfonate monooxygenase SsuD/methylene tetrahydromethanopterin reductase-like flavin-dependent oxidoreductase (luciferase family)